MAQKILLITIYLFCLSIVSVSSPDESKAAGEMIFIKGGEFLMGNKELPFDADPVHSVTLIDFYMGKFEVTQQEWKAVMGTNPSLYKGENLPVETIDWYEAVEFCNKKSKREGLTPCYQGSGDKITCNFDADGYRLPTEAEWEYACGGGLQSGNFIYSGSNNLDDVAWYEVNSGLKTQPVGRKKPNKLGIFDMSGNVREWCWDWYDTAYYKTGPADNPQGPAQGNRRCYRGGSGMEAPTKLRLNQRFNISPDYKNFDTGLRLVKNTVGKLPEGMVQVKGGTFKMGNNEGKYGGKLEHSVTLNSFYIGKLEVTQLDWKKIMGRNPSYRKGNYCPVNFVDWYDAVEYCNRRSQKEGLTPCYSGTGDNIVCNFEANGYRLPTEAEWEYAARGGALSRHYTYSGSNDPEEVAWYLNNIVIFYQPTAQKKSNELGIYDMSGNVWEWCWDWYDFDYYQNSPAKNPTGPQSGIRRAVRGGGFTNPEHYLRNSARFRFEPIRMGLNVGFRVVRSAK